MAATRVELVFAAYETAVLPIKLYRPVYKIYKTRAIQLPLNDVRGESGSISDFFDLLEIGRAHV